jgi:hypothetical protein
MGAENLGASVTVDAPSLTIKEFCELEKIGRTTFFQNGEGRQRTRGIAGAGS